jgi:MbtH protein
MADEGSPVGQFKVLVNDEEQYGLFPATLPVPDGWRLAGFSGTEAECSAWVDEHWTDMRPLSLRHAMDAMDAMDKDAA